MFQGPSGLQGSRGVEGPQGLEVSSNSGIGRLLAPTCSLSAKSRGVGHTIQVDMLI